ncbi:SulP family inorganic anion transporter [Helcobacillus massiliensis]|uniref:SulP family inorganic anion transporter n=1 Tax=Helcobacillus massiliensis TaxID=521392 RepID=UPI002555E616|nr:SulP family inorganic anion transporter [Helcobacillus massiliensis]MDK7741853.1 SulP family inorganic anion transporter [Helcobacillus massiliensis]WOO92956.1 SulP family inorganic anion transporter [Helcobacillus massiliensis]
MSTASVPAPQAPSLTPEQRQSWVRAVRSPRMLLVEVVGGLVTALALIPEVISFSIIAGVDPRMGLFTSFVMAVAIAVLGGRPAMITAAAGSVALVIAPLVREHGVQYLIATILLAGVLQIVMGLFGMAQLMRFIPRQVMVGFVNALAILIFMAQMHELIGVTWVVYPLLAAGLAIMVLLPRLTRSVPAPLVTVVVLTLVTVGMGLTHVPTVGDKGALPDSLPQLLIPDVPFDLETLRVILPYAVGVAFVGLLETLLTATLVDDITDTGSDKTRESWGLGAATVLGGLFGGMGGCAMIGQTMVNVRASGARTRISTALAGVFLLVLTVSLGGVVAEIPMVALVAVMVVVAVTTFDWHSVAPRTLRMMPRSELAVMLVTVAATVVTSNLAIGVGAGIVLACILFVRRVAHVVTLEREEVSEREVRYSVRGELFFASSNDLFAQFEYARDPASVVIDMSEAHIWDASTVAALDSVIEKYRRAGITAQVAGLNQVSRRMRVRLSRLSS